MLSITPLKGAGRADADRLAAYPREDGQDGPADTVEDYYSQGQNGAPSQWLGSGAAALGLAGSVRREHQVSVLMGEHPRTGEILGRQPKPGRARRMGVDLTFSAPKSVSVAWASGSLDLRELIEKALDRAVARTFKNLEQRLELGRRGAGGSVAERVKLVASAYRHGSSREQDPQMHVHLILANLAERMDGSWGSIENNPIMKNKMALGAMFRAELAAAMIELGLQVERDGDSFKLVAVSQAACDEFSRRRDQIRAAMAEHGTTGGRAANVAALATRKGKEVLDSEVLQADWQQRAAAHGITAASLEAACFQAPDAEHPPLVYDRAEVLAALTKGESTFTEPAIWREVAVAAQGVEGMNADAIEHEVASLMQDHELVRLRARPDLEDHSKIRSGRAAQRYTTRAMLELEKDMVALAEQAQSGAAHAVPATKVDAALQAFATEAGFHLSQEQQAAVRHICEAPGDVKLVRGAAGAGKTTMAKAARMAWESQGLRVRGAALAGKAGIALHQDAGIQSSTIASLLMQCSPGPDGAPPRDPLTSKDVLMVDEAGMVGSRQMHQLLKLCQDAGAKVVLIGDEKQLQAVEAGGAFRALQQRIGCAAMTANQRQRKAHADMATAVAHAERGEAGEALALLSEHGLVAVEADRDKALQETVDRWAARIESSGKPQECLMLASTKASVAALNEAALAHEKARGVLGPGAVITSRDRAGKSLGQREILEGGRILFRKNDKQLGVMNGELGTVERVDLDPSGKPIITVKLDRGASVTIRPEHEHKGQGRPEPGVGYSNVEHGWAVTVHAAQGATVDHAISFLDGSMSAREMFYVLLSRMRFSTDLIFNVKDLEKDEDMLPPTEGMVAYAVALGLEEDSEVLESFAATREWLDEHPTKTLGNTPKDGLSHDLRRLKDIAKAMSQSRAKDTTLDYEEAPEPMAPAHPTAPDQQQRAAEPAHQPAASDDDGETE
jgi:Ti-type conjugative transfer relaxase TraA